MLPGNYCSRASSLSRFRQCVLHVRVSFQLLRYTIAVPIKPSFETASRDKVYLLGYDQEERADRHSQPVLGVLNALKRHPLNLPSRSRNGSWSTSSTSARSLRQGRVLLGTTLHRRCIFDIRERRDYAARRSCYSYGITSQSSVASICWMTSWSSSRSLKSVSFRWRRVHCSNSHVLSLDRASTAHRLGDIAFRLGGRGNHSNS